MLVGYWFQNTLFLSNKMHPVNAGALLYYRHRCFLLGKLYTMDKQQQKTKPKQKQPKQTETTTKSHYLLIWVWFFISEIAVICPVDLQNHKVDFNFFSVARSLVLLAVASNLVLKVSFKPPWEFLALTAVWERVLAPLTLWCMESTKTSLGSFCVIYFFLLTLPFFCLSLFYPALLCFRIYLTVAGVQGNVCAWKAAVNEFSKHAASTRHNNVH